MSTFSDVVGSLAGGSTHERLGNHLNDVVQAVIKTGKVGEVTLKLTIRPNGEVGVMITDDIKAKVPELTRGTTAFFSDEHGNLLRRDPRQGDMFREVADKDTGELRRVPA